VARGRGRRPACAAAPRRAGSGQVALTMKWKAPSPPNPRTTRHHLQNRERAFLGPISQKTDSAYCEFRFLLPGRNASCQQERRSSSCPGCISRNRGGVCLAGERLICADMWRACSLLPLCFSIGNEL
jgi:hypothetical protein